MSRATATLILGMTLTMGAQAAQIQLGGGTNGVNGLTAAYMGTAVTNERSYTLTLFSGDTISSPSSALPTGTTVGGANELTDPNNHVQFNTIAGDTNGSSCVSGGCDYWAVSASQTLTIPVANLTEIDSAYVLMNDYWGVSGNSYATVDFNYATGPSAVFVLTEGNQIDDATDCAAAVNLSPACTSFARTASSSGTSVAWTANYSNSGTPGTNLPYNGTSGTATSGTGLNLSDIDFSLTATSTPLVSITITESSSAGSPISKLAVSAVTLDQLSSEMSETPEPATFALLGVGVLVLCVRRRLV